MALKHVLAGALAPWLLRLLRLTWRVDEQPPRLVTRRGANSETGAIYVMWHSRILLGVTTQAGQGMHVMISMHGDGELIARAAERMGFRPIRGSTSRGGLEALRATTTVLENGGQCALTPDGPRGPRMTVQAGCVLAAMRAGVPVIPVGFEARRMKRLRSWDRFAVPYPFTRVAVRFGAPIMVPAGLDSSGLSAYCERVRVGLLAVTREAADALGVTAETPEIDPLPAEPVAPASG